MCGFRLLPAPQMGCLREDRNSGRQRQSLRVDGEEFGTRAARRLRVVEMSHAHPHRPYEGNAETCALCNGGADTSSGATAGSTGGELATR